MRMCTMLGDMCMRINDTDTRTTERRKKTWHCKTTTGVVLWCVLCSRNQISDKSFPFFVQFCCLSCVKIVVFGFICSFFTQQKHCVTVAALHANVVLSIRSLKVVLFCNCVPANSNINIYPFKHSQHKLREIAKGRVIILQLYQIQATHVSQAGKFSCK